MSQNRELPIKFPYIRGGADGSYIDTGITPDNTTRIIVWARNFNPSATTNTWLCGSRVAYGNSMFAIVTGAGIATGCIAPVYGNTAISYTTDTFRYVSDYHKYELSANGFYIDDVFVQNVPQDTFSCAHNIILFGLNQAGNIFQSDMPIDIFACKIYKNGVLVRDYTAVNDPNVGLYDNVSETLFVNSGTGSFVYKLYNPNSYIRLKHIELTNAQYFDTGIYGKQDTPIILKFKTIGNVLKYPTLFGTMNQNTAGTYFIMQLSNSTNPNSYLSLYLNTTSSNQLYGNTKYPITNREFTFVRKIDNAQIYENTVSIGSKSLSVSSFTTPYTLGFGTTKLNGDFYPQNAFNGYIYYANFGPQRNYIPVLINNVAGMYDTYNDQFYPSITETAFVAGPLINQQYDAEIEYLEADNDGNARSVSFINTGVYPTNNTKVDAHMWVPNYETSEYGHWFFGSYESGGNRFEYFYNQNNNQQSFGRGNGGTALTTALQSSSDIYFNNIANADVLNITNNGNTYSITKTTNAFKCNYYLELFGINVANSHGSSNAKPGTRIYSFKIYEGSNLIRDYIPVRIGQIGYLYDKISGKLYGNSGSGSFILGPDIVKTDYLGFNGTQYINTLIKPLSYPNALDFKIEYRSYCPMNWGWVSQNVASKIWIGSGDKKAYWNTYSTSQVLNNPAKSTWHTYIFDAGSGFYIDGNKEVNFTATVPSSTATSANSVPLYIGNTWDTTAQVVENYTDGHLQLIEYVKIWNNDVLVRDFIPVIVNGEGYFYDRISKQLFGNSGTGSFVLPKSLDDYVRIEYLQSTNANNDIQYITTQYIPTPNTKLVLDAALNNTSVGGTFVGIYDGNNPNKRFNLGTYQNKWHFGVGTTNANNTWVNFDSPALDTTRHLFTLQGNGYCSVDSTSKQLSPNNTSTYNLPIHIFTMNRNVGTSTPGRIRLWSMKLYEGDTLTMDLVPCRDSNNVGYLYDTISKQTFENAGTGSFVVGPDIT